MKINIQGRHLDVTSSLKEYIEKKTQKVSYYFDHIIEAHVIIGVEKLKHFAEVSLVAGGSNFFSKSTTMDMYEAIDLLFDKLEKQVRKHKEKNSSHKKQSLYENIRTETDEHEINSQKITKTKTIDLKPM